MEDIINEEQSLLEETFDRASKHLTSLVSSLSSVDLLYCYARYKQATEGECNIAKPGGLFNVNGKRKWEAWKGLSGMSKSEAMQEYIRAVEERDPEWCADDANQKSSSGSTTGWVRVSTLAAPEEPLITTELDAKDSFLDAVRDAKLDVLQELDLAFHSNQCFSNDMTGLHWAADRGHADVAELLLKSGANVDSQDDVGQTPLHYAASCGHANMVKLLLQWGADTTITDEDGSTAKEVSLEEVVILLS